MKLLKRFVKLGLLAAGSGFLLIQLVPYGRNHTNPPIIREPDWDSLQTRALAQRACFDCHSNETVWPWYSNIAPISWLAQHDTEEGRESLNFSEWGAGRENERPGELVESVQEGEMPPFIYLTAQSQARLTAAEKQQLIEGLWATAGGSGPVSAGKHE